MEFLNTYQNLGPKFFSSVEIEPLKNPQWLIHNEAAFRVLGQHSPNPQEFIKWFNGETRKPGDQKISHVYAGHQFGVWAGQLGDGRALSLGELNGWDIQLKGSGKTPYSRFGDGKAVIRSCIREFLASQALASLEIPTTLALAVITGTGDVQREQFEREAMCVRLLPSNIRFGTFEWFASQGDTDSLRKLVSYCQTQYFPNIEKTLPAFLKEVTLRTAKMVAYWQAFGFCHGVMNTDNMSILGVTLDYGPYGFLENFDFDYICNHSDHQGRYSYGRQPSIALWNLQRLAAVFKYMDDGGDLEPALAAFVPAFEEAYFGLMCEKLGLPPSADSRELIQDFMSELQEQKLDYSYTLRKFSDETYPELQMPNWLPRYEKLRSSSAIKNPIYVLKNYVAERAIRQVEDQNSDVLLKQVFKVLQDPFTKIEGLEWWSNPSPEKERNLSVSCSS